MSAHCLCQNLTCSWRDKPESPFSLNIYEVPETSGCLAQESWPALFKCPAAQGWPSGPPSVPSPFAVRLALLRALSPPGRGTHVVHVCTLRLHCSVVCWLEPQAGSGPESLTTEDRCQASCIHCLLEYWVELRASVWCLVWFVCLFVCLL